MPRKLYPAVVHTDEGRVFGASFVDFPVHAGGTSVEAAFADAEAVIAEVVEGMHKDKETIPEPTAIADIPKEDREGALVALVPVEFPYNSHSEREAEHGSSGEGDAQGGRGGQAGSTTSP